MPISVAQLTWNDWRGGWSPSSDAKNGPKNVLLQMDNVELDKNGALTLVGGTSVVQAGYQAAAHTLYSRILNGTRQDYAALANGHVFRGGTDLITGGDSTNSAFDNAFDYVLIASGNQRKKDNVTSLVELGVQIPGVAPVFLAQDQVFTPEVNTGNIVIPDGTAFIDPLDPTIFRMRADQATGVAAIQSYLFPGVPFDWTVFPDGGIQTDNDTLSFAIGSFVLGSDDITIDILLDPPGAAGDPVANTYTFSPVLDDFIPIDADSNTFGTYFLKIRRSQFVRRGFDSRGWDKVYGFRITYTTPFFGLDDKGLELGLGDQDPIRFTGGSHAQDGIYEYAEMFVNNT